MHCYSLARYSFQDDMDTNSLKKKKSRFIYLEQTVKLDSSWTKLLDPSINKYILCHIYTYIKITFVLYYYGYSY